jgi:hypothetical protein
MAATAISAFAAKPVQHKTEAVMEQAKKILIGVSGCLVVCSPVF